MNNEYSKKELVETATLLKMSGDALATLLRNRKPVDGYNKNTEIVMDRYARCLERLPDICLDWLAAFADKSEIGEAIDMWSEFLNNHKLEKPNGHETGEEAKAGA